MWASQHVRGAKRNRVDCRSQVRLPLPCRPTRRRRRRGSAGVRARVWVPPSRPRLLSSSRTARTSTGSSWPVIVTTPCEPFNSTPMAANSISFGSPHVRPTWACRTCGEPNENQERCPPEEYYRSWPEQRAATLRVQHTRANVGAGVFFFRALVVSPSRLHLDTTGMHRAGRFFFSATCFFFS